MKKKKFIWMVVSCLMALSLVLASCGEAEEEEEEEVIVPPEEEEEVIVPPEEEEEVKPPVGGNWWARIDLSLYLWKRPPLECNRRYKPSRCRYYYARRLIFRLIHIYPQRK